MQINTKCKILQLIAKKVLPGNPSRSDISILSTMMSLYEDHPHSIRNRSLVIHAGSDDLGRGDSPKSLTGGNAGPVVVCGVVTPADEVEPDQVQRPTMELPEIKAKASAKSHKSEPVISNIEDKLYGAVDRDAPRRHNELGLSLKEPVATSKSKTNEIISIKLKMIH
jgi:Copper/zinc superoxide dismutase (SODC)